MDNIFATRNEDIDDHTSFTLLEFETLSPELSQLLDENLVSICEGDLSTSTLQDVKNRIIELFANKEAEADGEYSNWEMGAVAEIFIHLYIKTIGLKQECMFLNLEERSVKKGFDGYYTDQSDHWIMESKSGSINSMNASHGSKLNEAIKDLQKKFSGASSVKNNPWREAFNHASHKDVNTAEDIRKYLKGLATEFTNGVFHNANEFNIIPCATLYFEEEIFTDSANIVDQAKEQTTNNPYKKARLICVSNRSVGIFKKYIGLVK